MTSYAMTPVAYLKGTRPTCQEPLGDDKKNLYHYGRTIIVFVHESGDWRVAVALPKCTMLQSSKPNSGQHSRPRLVETAAERGKIMEGTKRKGRYMKELRKRYD